MENIKELAAAIDRDRLKHTSQMNPEDKLSAGIELFEFACSISRAGILSEHPHADADEVERILAQRIELGSRVEIGGWKPNR